MKERNLNEWKECFLNGEFNSNDFCTQTDAGWYDWFCMDSELASKTKFLGEMAIQLFDSPKVNKESTYLWFKNNCPCVGPLFDDFRFADIKTGNVLFTICKINEGCYGEDFDGWEIWDFVNENGSHAIRNAVLRGEWNDVVKYFYQ